MGCSETGGGDGIGVESSRAARFRALRQRVGRIVPSNYDVTDRCNLRCEGCLFYAGDDYTQYHDAADPRTWRSFFAADAARGVNFAYVAGGEPALVPDRLRLIAEHIPHGVIFTNGTRRIADDIGYRIHVSVWGDRAQSRLLRGADSTAKAMENYAGDPRALFTYTVSALNIAGIYPTAQRLHACGLRMTISYFSPTTDYRDASGDPAFLRLAQAERNPCMTPDAFRRARAEVRRTLQDFPDTLIYSLEYDDWVSNPDGVYDIDPITGIARDCGNRSTPAHRHHNVDLSRSQQKCCSPNLDCRTCRPYAQAYATYLHRFATRRDPVQFARWLAVWELWADMFMPPATPGRASVPGERACRPRVAEPALAS